MAQGIMADTHRLITGGRITADTPRHITVTGIDACTAPPTRTTVGRVTMADFTTDGIIGITVTGEKAGGEIDFMAPCSRFRFLSRPAPLPDPCVSG